MKRRDFIQKLIVSGFLLFDGSVLAKNLYIVNEEVKLRFYVASDGHYGQSNTPYKEYHSALIEKMNQFHLLYPASFVVLNGDVIDVKHDEKQYLTSAFNTYNNFEMDFYVTKGNHDQVSADFWRETWGYPQNHDFTIRNTAFLLGTTSNEKGDYLCPDLNWFKTKLNLYRHYDYIFIFLHITPNDWTKYGVKCTEFLNLIDNHKNIKAIFNGHDHNQDGIKFYNNIPFMFDGRFGGSWGTDYRGFRVVEILNNGIIQTYMMNPDEKIKQYRLEQA